MRPRIAAAGRAAKGVDLVVRRQGHEGRGRLDPDLLPGVVGQYRSVVDQQPAHPRHGQFAAVQIDEPDRGAVLLEGGGQFPGDGVGAKHHDGAPFVSGQAHPGGQEPAREPGQQHRPPDDGDSHQTQLLAGGVGQGEGRPQAEERGIIQGAAGPGKRGVAQVVTTRPGMCGPDQPLRFRVELP